MYDTRRSVIGYSLAAIAAAAVLFGVLAPAPGQPGSRRTTATRDPAQRSSRSASASGRKAAAIPDAGWLGVMLKQSDSGQPMVSEVFPAGPAAYAGIRKGDRIAKVAGRPAKLVAAFVSAIEKSKPGQKIEIVVVRGKKEVKLTAVVHSLRRFHQRYAAEMLRRDPRDPDFGKHPGVSPADMSIEVTRRLFEQNKRLETSLHQVLVELNALRKEVRALKKK
jgi:PDZ domain